MSLPRYPQYKDSGMEWLEQVPAHWDVWKLAHAFPSIGSGTTPKSDNPAYYEDGNTSWLNTGDLNDGELFECEKKVSALALTEHTTLRCYPENSVAIAMYGATIGKLAILRFKTTVNQACCVFGDSQQVLTKFLFYWLLGFRQQIISLATGGGQPNISQEILRSLRLACPHLEEQTAIATFLDRETGKIDALIAEQEKLLTLLAEKRQATISHAVTKGLNPAAPMKDSGVEWLGQVPAHWLVTPLRYCIDFQEGPGIMASDFLDSGIPLLRVSGVQGRWATLDGCNYLSEVRVAEKWKHFRLNKGDLLISASASMGTVCEVDAATAGAVPYTGLIRLTGKQGKMVKQFVRFLVTSNQFIVQIDLLKAGATIQHFGPTHLSQMTIVCPPIDEQGMIAEYIEQETTRLEALTADATRAIDLLKERRSALISAAVTGKIDVRGVVKYAPLQNEPALK